MSKGSTATVSAINPKTGERQEFNMDTQRDEVEGLIGAILMEAQGRQLVLFEGEPVSFPIFPVKSFSIPGLPPMKLGEEATVSLTLQVKCIAVKGYRDKEGFLYREHTLAVIDQERI